MAGIQIAESKERKVSPKTLDHLELHPQLGGGHLVKHVYSGYDHQPKEYKFNASGKSQGGEHIVRHLVKHGGLPAASGTMEDAAGGNGDETEKE